MNLKKLLAAITFVICLAVMAGCSHSKSCVDTVKGAEEIETD